jgi:hypothetical protein
MTTRDGKPSSADGQSAVSRVGDAQPPDSQEVSTGLPWFHSWYGVYWFVLGCFVVYVVLLTVFSRAFS